MRALRDARKTRAISYGANPERLFNCNAPEPTNRACGVGGGALSRDRAHDLRTRQLGPAVRSATPDWLPNCRQTHHGGRERISCYRYERVNSTLEGFRE
jgi:hypothetical protein